MNAEEILRIINVSGAAGLLVVIILGGAKRFWVFGWQYREVWEEKERWKEAAFKNTTVAQGSNDVAQMAAQAAALATALMKQGNDK